MVLIAIITGVYKPTYNWGAPPCMWHSPLLRLARSIQGGSRPAWGWNPGGGMALCSTAETHGSIMDLRSIKTLLCFYLYLQEIHKQLSKTINNYQQLSKTHFSKPENSQVVNLVPENRPWVQQINRPFPSCVLIIRPSGGGEVGKERKALEQLPKVLQTQWGTDELIRGIISKWLNLRKVYESL